MKNGVELVEPGGQLEPAVQKLMTSGEVLPEEWAQIAAPLVHWLPGTRLDASIKSFAKTYP